MREYWTSLTNTWVFWVMNSNGMSSRLGIENDPGQTLNEDGQIDVLDVQAITNIVLTG